MLRRAQIGVHRPLAVGRHQDVTAPGRGTVGRKRRGKRHLGGPNIVRKGAAEPVVLHLAEENRARAEARDADDRVGGGPAGYLDGGAHRCVDRLGAGFIDQLHAAFVHAVADEEIFFGARDHVHDGVADADDIVARGAHGILLKARREPPGRAALPYTSDPGPAICPARPYQRGTSDVTCLDRQPHGMWRTAIGERASWRSKNWCSRACSRPGTCTSAIISAPSNASSRCRRATTASTASSIGTPSRCGRIRPSCPAPSARSPPRSSPAASTRSATSFSTKARSPSTRSLRGSSIASPAWGGSTA